MASQHQQRIERMQYRSACYGYLRALLRPEVFLTLSRISFLPCAVLLLTLQAPTFAATTTATSPAVIAPGVPASNGVVLVHPDANQALQQKTVLQIHEDKLGFLWLVTQGALHRFDGHDLLSLPQPDQTGAALRLGNSPVVAVTSGPDGMIWIATIGEGFIQFDPDSGLFRSAEDLGLTLTGNSRRVQAIAVTEQGVYWLCPDGLMHWKPNQAKPTHIANPLGGERFDGIWFAAGQLWLAAEKNLMWLDAQNRPQVIADKMINGWTTAVIANPDGAVMAFGSYGVAIQSHQGAPFTRMVLHHPAWSVDAPDGQAPAVLQALVEPDGTLWAVAPSVGVLQRPPDGSEIVHPADSHDPTGLPEKDILSVSRDRAGRVWFGTLAHGFFYRAEGHQWLSVVREPGNTPEQPLNNIFALLPDEKGGLWLGAESSGLRYLDREGRIVDHNDPLRRAGMAVRRGQPAERIHVRSLLVDGDNLLVGHARGLWRYSPSRQQAEQVLSEFLSHSNPFQSAVRSLKRRHNGDVLIASDSAGLLLWSSTGTVQHYYTDGEGQYHLPTNRVLDVLEDRQQQVWLATDSGLFRFRDNNPAQMVAADIPSDFINTLYEAPDGDLWIGTFGGVVRLQNVTTAQPIATAFSIRDGLRDNVIYAIRSDRRGDLWASTNRGLVRLRPNESRWQYYDRLDGLSDDEFNLNAAAILPDGRLAFGGLSGVSIIDPDREPRVAVDMPLVVTAMQRAHNDQQPNWARHLAPLSLQADASQLLLRVAAPGAAQLHQQHFFYRLDGDQRWLALGNKRELSLVGMAPGLRTLEMAWSHGNSPQSPTLTVTIDVVPAWWQRSSVRTLAVLLVLLVVASRWWTHQKRLEERLRNEQALRASDERLRLALWGTGDALWDWNLQTGRVERTGLANLLGYPEEEIESTLYWRDKLTHPEDAEATTTSLQHHLDGQTPYYEAQYRLRSAKGDWLWVLDRGQIVERNKQGLPLRMAGTMRDISDRRRRDDELQYLANYDSLTELPNRTLFQDRLQHALTFAARRDHQVALLFIDLDRFKSVNDSYGHRTGDALLRSVATRLRGSVRDEDTVARLGGDEFTIILEGVTQMQAVSRVVDSLQQAFALPFETGEQSLLISPSIGISVFPSDADCAEKLINHADMAMYSAKESGRNTVRYFEAYMNAAAQRRAAISLALRKAEAAGELALHYQPRMDLKSQRITGFEALMRWTSDSLGPVTPTEFIPIAEEFGLIARMGEWALASVYQQLTLWQDTELANLPVAVNVSIRQLMDDSFFDRVKAAQQELQLPESLLQIEVTETLMMENTGQVVATLQKLRDSGIAICIDDFGTGYSSLGHLRRLPIDGLKIDKSFVNNVVSNNDDAVIVATIIAMAHALHLTVVAEGVETEAQLKHLRDQGCEEIQGYWLARPMPAEQCEAFLRKHNAGRGENSYGAT